MRRFGEPRLVVVARWIWLCELIPLPRQKLPAAVLLLPDLQCADPGAVGLAVQFAFRNVEMAGNRTAADDRNLQFRESIDLTVVLRFITPLTTSALLSTRLSEWP